MRNVINLNKMKKLLILILLQLFVSSQSFADAKTDLANNIKDYEKKILGNQSNYFISSDEPAEKMRVLGYHNFTGKAGNKKNYQRSIMWFEMASKYGHPGGAYYLGLFHYGGTAGLEQNFNKAHDYFVLAYEHWTNGDFRFGMGLEDFSNDMNRLNSNPSKEFAKLRDLFIKAIDVPSNDRYQNLKNLSTKSKVVTIDNFLNSEKQEVLCGDGSGYNLKIKIYASVQNEFILRAINSLVEDLLTKEEFLLSYSYAKKIDDEIEWFHFNEDEMFGDGMDYYKLFFNNKTKKINLYYQPYDITKSSEVYLKAYNQYKLMKKEKLLDPGGDKHLNLERKLNEYFYKNYKKMKKKLYDGSVETYNMVCEL